MKIYDCFQFFNELDLLEIRLNIMNDYVDYFVLTESTVTFSGLDKPLYYQENKDQFEKFNDKIIHVIVDDTPDKNPFERDVFQKNAIIRGLQNCEDADIIITSDIDEIPDPEIFDQLVDDCEDNKVYHFAQDLFYYYLNLKEVSGNLNSYTGEFNNVKEKKWLGSKMCKYQFLKQHSVNELRAPNMKECGYRISPGGWHFTYVGSDGSMTPEQKIAHKIECAAHQEFNNDAVKSKIVENVKSNKDIFYRPSEFEVVEIDGSFPQYIRDNQEKYQYIIK
jgi:beta-1,4-mannosyl-glycoprotein beta-1,4-N-acetylglucosaminyltransferase